MTYRFLPADTADRLRKAGLEVIEIDGWQKRGRPASTGEFKPVGVLNHHTGARDVIGDFEDDLAYARWLFLQGRSDLSPPLCQLSISLEGKVYLGAAGRANHAGKAKASGSVAAGDGNALYVGIEWMLSGTQKIPVGMYAAGVITNAVLLDILGSSEQAVSCHYQTSVTGKWDIGDPDGIPFNGARVMDVDKFRAAIKAHRTPKPAPAPATTTVRIQHSSLQFSDPANQQRSDATSIFTRGADLMSWTEANRRQPLFKALKAAGPKAGYTVDAHPSGLGIAVKDSFGKIVDSGFVPVIDGKARQYNDRGIKWVEVETEDDEHIVFGAVHYITDGRNPADGFRFQENQRYAKAIGAFARAHGLGRRTVFIAGDFNIVDKRNDVFMGQPLTTCWDELRKHPNTGHGNIDAIASYDADSRVDCSWARAVDDTKLPLFSDHLLIEAQYAIKDRRV